MTSDLYLCELVVYLGVSLGESSGVVVVSKKCGFFPKASTLIWVGVVLILNVGKLISGGFSWKIWLK